MTQNKSSLATRALLVGVNISQWTGRKQDSRATETVSTTYKTDSTAGTYTKKLLPGAKELDAINAIVSQDRKYVLEQTLPWLADGTRILAAKNYIPFQSGIGDFKAKFETAVRDFEAAYPALRANAASKLGDLYSVSEYPHESEIASRFRFEAVYLPMPDSGDFRVEVSETQRRDFEAKMQAVESRAMVEVWQRLHGVIKNAAEKLAKPDAIFRDSLLTNVTDLVSMLPLLNVSESPELMQAGKEVSDLVARLSPDTLRDNARERDNASKALSDIESRMGAFMGAIKS